MKLEDCTREELLKIIILISKDSCIFRHKVNSALSELEFSRTNRILREADNWNIIASDCRKRYAALLKPYEHSKLVDVPLHIIKEADQCLKDARRADREWDLCMKRLGD